MAEDFNALRLLTRKLVRVPFQKSWQFRLEVDGEPADFDLFVKDISYSSCEIETDGDKYGGVTMTWPVARGAVQMSVTMRDHEDERVAKWIDKWKDKVADPKGTVGLPYGNDGYVKKVRKYNLRDNGEEVLSGEWEMYPTTRGDISQSRESAEFLEFPVIFVQFRS